MGSEDRRAEMEANERIIKELGGNAGWEFMESDEHRADRYALEANRLIIQDSGGYVSREPFEGDDRYAERMALEANKITGDSNGGCSVREPFESREHYQDRMKFEADQSILRANGTHVARGITESDSSYRASVAREANSYRPMSKSSDDDADEYCEPDDDNSPGSDGNEPATSGQADSSTIDYGDDDDGYWPPDDEPTGSQKVKTTGPAKKPPVAETPPAPPKPKVKTPEEVFTEQFANVTNIQILKDVVLNTTYYNGVMKRAALYRIKDPKDLQSIYWEWRKTHEAGERDLLGFCGDEILSEITDEKMLREIRQKEESLFQERLATLPESEIRRMAYFHINPRISLKFAEHLIATGNTDAVYELAIRGGREDIRALALDYCDKQKAERIKQSLMRSGFGGLFHFFMAVTDELCLKLARKHREITGKYL